MIFEEGMILADLLNTAVHPFSVYLSAPYVPIKVVFYLLKLYYEFEAVRGDAAFFCAFFSSFYCCARFKPLPEP